MGICTANSRSRALKRNRHRISCWRNPFIVFFVDFCGFGIAALSSSARSKKVASKFLKRREQQRLNRATKEGIDTSTMASGISNDFVFNYSLVEEAIDTRSDRSFQKYNVLHNPGGALVTVEQWANTIAKASENDPAIELLNKAIASSPFQAVFFETPPVSSVSSQQPFEFVLMDAPELHEMASNHPDVNAFTTPISTAKRISKFAATFPNLGRDAILIVPKPITEDNQCYSHLAQFVRNAPPSQIAAVWSMAAQTYLERIAEQKQRVWFSTSGMGVAWLHFRLDNIPKYYTYAQYK